MDKEAAIKLIIGAAVFLSLVACSGEKKSDASKPSGVIPQHQLDALGGVTVVGNPLRPSAPPRPTFPMT